MRLCVLSVFTILTAEANPRKNIFYTAAPKAGVDYQYDQGGWGDCDPEMDIVEWAKSQFSNMDRDCFRMTILSFQCQLVNGKNYRFDLNLYKVPTDSFPKCEDMPGSYICHVSISAHLDETKKINWDETTCPRGYRQRLLTNEEEDADANSGKDYADEPECTSGQTKGEGCAKCDCVAGVWLCRGFCKPDADANSGKDYADEPECTSGQTKKEGSLTCTCSFGNWRCTSECTSGQTKGQGCAKCDCVAGVWLCRGYCKPGKDHSNDYSMGYPPPSAQDFANPMPEESQGKDYHLDLICEALINPSLAPLCAMLAQK